jgi:hypothetical protein
MTAFELKARCSSGAPTSTEQSTAEETHEHPTIRTVQFAELIEFVAVAEYRTLTAAAARLGVSTATLTWAIRAVEDGLGLRLLNWTARRVAPTPVGECLLEKLRPILEDLESALADEPGVPIRCCPSVYRESVKALSIGFP